MSESKNLDSRSPNDNTKKAFIESIKPSCIIVIIALFACSFFSNGLLPLNIVFNVLYKTNFPPIKPGTVRVFVTHCKNTSEYPKFIDAEVTFARCHIMNGTHCGEAPFMIDFLINWYDNLTEETVVFTHGHTSSWHIKNITEAVQETRYTDYFINEPYGGFKDAVWKWTCDTPSYQDMYSYMFNETSMPRVWTRFGVYPCCATFFVKTEQIRKRPKEDYIQIYKNLEKWVELNPNLGFHCGRLFEYVWHVLLADKKIIPRPIENVTFKWSRFDANDPCRWNKNF